MKKKIFVFITVMGLIPVAIPANAMQSGTCGENLTWTLDNGILTISGTGDMEDYTLFCKDWNDYTKSLPPWHSPYPNITTLIVEEGVTSIGDFAFESLSSLSSVTLPDTITRIGDSAFFDCSFTEISIPNVTYIGNGAFSGCEELKSISIPFGVTAINASTFSFCTNLIKVEIPESVTEIESGAFICCEALSEIALPAGLRKIGEEAFSSTALSTVHIPDSVTYIGSSAFSFCDNLTEFTYPETADIGVWAFDSLDFETHKDEYGVVYYNNHLLPVNFALSGEYTVKYGTAYLDELAFWNSTKLTNVILPDTVTHIEAEAFRECSSLENITIPDSVIEIGRYAFNNCTHLKSIYIPSTVTKIGRKAFLRCIRLEDIYFEGTPEQWQEITSNGSVLGLGSEKATIHYNHTQPENPYTASMALEEYLPEGITANKTDTGFTLSLAVDCDKVIATHYSNGRLTNVSTAIISDGIAAIDIAADTDDVKVWSCDNGFDVVYDIDAEYVGTIVAYMK